MADADGATKFADAEKLLNEIEPTKNGDHAIVVGSRHHLEQEAIAQVINMESYLFIVSIWIYLTLLFMRSRLLKFIF